MSLTKLYSSTLILQTEITILLSDTNNVLQNFAFCQRAPGCKYSVFINLIALTLFKAVVIQHTVPVWVDCNIRDSYAYILYSGEGT